MQGVKRFAIWGAAKQDLKQAKQHLKYFLLVQDVHYPGKANWNDTDRRRLARFSSLMRTRISSSRSICIPSMSRHKGISRRIVDRAWDPQPRVPVTSSHI